MKITFEAPLGDGPIAGDLKSALYRAIESVMRSYESGEVPACMGDCGDYSNIKGVPAGQWRLVKDSE